MKRQLFAALFLTAAAVAISPVANAAESKAVENIQSARLEHLDTQSKAIEDIQSTRLDFLDNQSKSARYETSEQLGQGYQRYVGSGLGFGQQSAKAVEDIQATRLEFLNNQSKAVENIQSARLAGLDARSKSSDR